MASITLRTRTRQLALAHKELIVGICVWWPVAIQTYLPF